MSNKTITLELSLVCPSCSSTNVELINRTIDKVDTVNDIAFRCMTCRGIFCTKYLPVNSITPSSIKDCTR